MKKRLLIPVVMLVVLLFGVSAHATLVDMNDGTVYDTTTQLSWLQNVGTGGTLSWDATNTWAGTVTTSGLSGWRQPSLSELQNLYSQGFGLFSNLPATCWTGTSVDSGIAKFFNFSNGQGGNYNKSNALNAWAVSFGARTIPCTNQSVQACPIANGTGQQICQSGTWGTCGAMSCNTGYALSNGVCVANQTPPTVTTATVSSITFSSAQSGGNVTSDGGSTVTARGICYGTSLNPTIADAHTTDGTGAGSFISAMSGLTQNTTYHVRAYATNGIGTSYGSDITFTTAPLTHVVIAAATGNGNITLDTSSPGCGFMTWDVKTKAQVNNDPSYDYPYGLVEFTLNCVAADVTITFPGSIAGTTYRKYGPTTPGNVATTAWYTFPNVTVNSDTSITLHLTDGQLGDDTGVDGIIVDQGGPGQELSPVAVPTMTEWGMIGFALFAGLSSAYYLRKRRTPQA